MVSNLFTARRLLLFELGVLLLLYASGAYVRMAPLSRYGVYVTADDPVLHVRVTEYVLENGHLPRNDTLAWYPWGQNWEKALPNFRYYLTAFLYSIGRMLGMGLSLYDFCVLFPAFFAPIAVFPMFLLVRKLRDWKSGLVSAGVLALSAGYLTRTIAGFYRHEQVGIPLLILCMYFFVKGMKAASLRENIVYSTLSGIVLVVLTGTWSGFRFLLDGYAVFVFLTLLVRRMDRRLFTTFIITDGLALASTLFWPRLSSHFYGTTEFAIALVVIVTVLIYELVLRQRLDAEKLPLATIAISVILFVSMFATISKLPTGRYEVVVNPLRSAPPGDVSQTVAEHAGMRLAIAGGKIEWPALKSYGIFLFLVPIGIFLPFMKTRQEDDVSREVLAMLVFTTFLLFLALDPYPALICYIIMWLGVAGLWYVTPDDARPRNEEMMMILFALLAAYFFKNMIRLNILFSAFVAIQSGLCFGYALDLIASQADVARAKRETQELRSKRRRDKKRRKRSRKEAPKSGEEVRRGPDYPQIALAGLVLLFLLLTMSSSYNSAKGYPLGLRDDWFQALDWIEENTQPDDVIMSWWDYGYWIQTYAKRPTLADGATTNSSQIRKLARAFITTESVANEFCREFDVRYVMVDISDDFVGGKWTAMAVIAKQNAADYMGLTEDGQTVIQDKGQQCLLFRLASPGALEQPLPPFENFKYRAMFTGERGGRVIIYEFTP